MLSPRRRFGTLFAALAAVTAFLTTGATIPTAAALSPALAALGAGVTPHPLLVDRADTASASGHSVHAASWVGLLDTAPVAAPHDSPVAGPDVLAERTGVWSPRAGRAPPISLF